MDNATPRYFSSRFFLLFHTYACILNSLQNPNDREGTQEPSNPLTHQHDYCKQRQHDSSNNLHNESNRHFLPCMARLVSNDSFLIAVFSNVHDSPMPVGIRTSRSSPCSVFEFWDDFVFAVQNFVDPFWHAVPIQLLN